MKVSVRSRVRRPCAGGKSGERVVGAMGEDVRLARRAEVFGKVKPLLARGSPLVRERKKKRGE